MHPYSKKFQTYAIVLIIAGSRARRFYDGIQILICCESEVWGVWRLSFSCLSFANQLFYFGGLWSFSAMDMLSLSRGSIYYVLLARIYTLQSTDVLGLANRRIISINLTYRVRHNWNLNPEGGYLPTKCMPDHISKRVLEYLFSELTSC